MSSASGFRSKPKNDRSKYMAVSGQVQNVQNSTVYIFGDQDIAEDEVNTEDQIEMSELRTRNKSHPKRGKRKKKTKHVEKEQMVLVEKDINEGDTLQTFSLQYGCPVSELKRVNNLITDQDFYARRKLKVPMRKHGILLEEEENGDAASKDANHVGPRLPNGHRYSDGSDDYSESDDSQTEFVRTISIPGSLDGENKAAQQFFDKMDKDLHQIIENTRTHKDSLEEVTSVLRETRFRPLAYPKADCPSDGATMGCTFRTLMIAVVVILFVVPIFGALYILKGKHFHL